MKICGWIFFHRSSFHCYFIDTRIYFQYIDQTYLFKWNNHRCRRSKILEDVGWNMAKAYWDCYSWHYCWAYSNQRTRKKLIISLLAPPPPPLQLEMIFSQNEGFSNCIKAAPAFVTLSNVCTNITHLSLKAISQGEGG